MDALDKKLLENFPGKVVRKDLTSLMKKGANVPTYVSEYLLGMYCSSENEELIKIGFEKIKKILTENYVKPDQSEYIKFKIRENENYTIIDKIYVYLDEKEDTYVACFTNLNIKPFKIDSSIVTHNEKLLLGGVWCLVKIRYQRQKREDDDEFDFDQMSQFGEDSLAVSKGKKEKKSKYSTSFTIVSLKAIQMPNIDLDQIFKNRKNFTKEEWIDILIRSMGYEPSFLQPKQKMHYLLRLVPLVQKNYNLVELGPRGTGKSHIYSEISPHSILISSGHTSVANLFYNLSRRTIGLVGHWDCIAFDEVGGMSGFDVDAIQTLKNYMANGSFARGTDSINADASISFEGNTFKSLEEMLKVSTLFDPFPERIRNDTAFFDRINAYLPGWETPKLKSELLTSSFGFITDFLSEFCHQMRKYDFTNLFGQYFSLNSKFSTRDEIAVRKTFSGLAKLIFPDESISKEDAKELLIYSIEGRRRVKEQLYKLDPVEFKDRDLGFIDNEDGTEYIIGVPERIKEKWIFEGIEAPGYVYAAGENMKNEVAIYRLENKLFPGTGTLRSKNIEGIPLSAKSTRESINAAFSYFLENSKKIISVSPKLYDFGLFFNDLQYKGVSPEVSVAEVVGLCSALANKPVLNSLVIVGRVVMSGAMMPVTTNLTELFNCAFSAGATRILFPLDSKDDVLKVRQDLLSKFQVLYYDTPIEAIRIALNLN